MRSIVEILNDVVDEEGIKTKVSFSADQKTLRIVSGYAIGTVALCSLAFFGIKNLLN